MSSSNKWYFYVFIIGILCLFVSTWIEQRRTSFPSSTKSKPIKQSAFSINNATPFVQDGNVIGFCTDTCESFEEFANKNNCKFKGSTYLYDENKMLILFCE